MKMLTIDDSSVVRTIIKEAVWTLGHDCLEAEDTEDAIRILEENGYNLDLIFLDWNMPGMNGLDFLKMMKSDKKYRHIPVMMVTSEGTSSSIVEAIKSGASQYIVKPFSTEDLLKKILECLGRGVL
ncbi:MAG: response regulator [Proteocatella sp.]